MNAASPDRLRVVELSLQVDEAVAVLWAAGNVPMVWRLLLEDCERLCVAGVMPADASTELQLLQELCEHGAALYPPSEPPSPAHRDLLDRIAAARRRLVARLQGRTARANRVRRWLLLGILPLLLGVVAFLLFRNTVSARASATYSSDYPVSQATDGLSHTDWLLPSQQAGWLELSFARPRAVQRVVLRNSSNGFYGDRATKAVRVEAYSGDRVVVSARGEFPPLGDQRPLLTLPLSASEVTHVRISIESYYGNGGGLAEVNVQ